MTRTPQIPAQFTITVDGRTVPARAGDTVAAALLRSGRLRTGDSIYRGRPRGILTAGPEEANLLLTVHREDGDESMLPGTVVEAQPGLEARTLRGIGALDPAPTRAAGGGRCNIHVEVLVVGAGPAGLAAAAAAARTQARVMLIEQDKALGGSLLAHPEESIDGRTAAGWIQHQRQLIQSSAEAMILTRTTALGLYDGNYVVAVERRNGHPGASSMPGRAPQRLWHITARQVVLATGSMERPLVFEDNDLPGVMLAHAALTYRQRYDALAAEQVLVAANNDSAYDLVDALAETAPRSVSVVDARPDPGGRAEAAHRRGVRVRTGAAVVRALGDDRVTGALISDLDEQGNLQGPTKQLPCDLLAVSGGWSPATQLHAQRQGRVAWDPDLQGFLPDGDLRGVRSVGACRGAFSTALCAADGAAAGAAAAQEAGFLPPLDRSGEPGTARQDAAPVPPDRAALVAAAGTTRALWAVPSEDGSDPRDWHRHFLDLQRDSTVADVVRGIGAGLCSVEHIKRYTSISTGADQGKTSSVPTIGLIAQLIAGDPQRAEPGAIGTTTARAPFAPVAFGTLAGNYQGSLYDPIRVTPMHPWHVEHGAVFENVGQWKRPRYYPQPGEDMASAVRRECRAVRESVGMLDGTTLGKIELTGPDVGLFLDRLYTNRFSTQAPGKGKYGIMCHPDGMIFDDGVTLRLDASRWLLSTTTGNAAAVLDWLELWHQTEWPRLRVRFTSVTEQWATVVLAGPRSREVLARLAPDLDVSPEGFGFMQVRETLLPGAVPARIARVTFSGELAFEISVPGWYGLSIWEQVAAAGAPYGIQPYGTEAMHVLRAEKGFPIVGQDTDGTVTPHDLGMGWAVSRVKPFIGQRSFSRLSHQDEQRKQWVSLRPEDPQVLLAEGAQIVADGVPVRPEPGRSVPMLGHVTSSYDSPALGRTFALALVRGGRARDGQTVQVVSHGAVHRAVVGPTVLFDPENTRRDGDPS